MLIKRPHYTLLLWRENETEVIPINYLTSCIVTVSIEGGRLYLKLNTEEKVTSTRCGSEATEEDQGKEMPKDDKIELS